MSEALSSTQNQFQHKAPKARPHPALGSIQVNTPPAFWAVSLLATTFVISSAVYLYLGHYTRTATMTGMLVPTAGLMTLSATGPGQVLQVDVHQGDRVLAGQTLASFEDPLNSAALGNTRELISSELESERKGLQQDLVTQSALSASQMTSTEANITNLEAQVTQIDGQLELQQREAAMTAKLLKSILPLRKQGIVSIYDMQQQQISSFNAELQVKALNRERLSLTQQLSQARQQLRQIPLTLASQENVTRNKLAQVAQNLAQNEAQREWVLKAPRTGIVSTLLMKLGQPVTTGQPLLTMVPAGSRLEAQLLVPSSAIGFVHEGQRVVLRYQAFPYQKFGLHFGEVEQVSRSALSPQEVAMLVGGQVTAPLYRVMVRLNDQYVQAYGEPVALRPGMALSADIRLDRRRLIEWILEPLYGFGRRMMTQSATMKSGSEAATTRVRA